MDEEEPPAAPADLVKVNTTYFRVYARHRHLMRVIREAAASAPEFARLWQAFVDAARSGRRRRS